MDDATAFLTNTSPNNTLGFEKNLPLARKNQDFQKAMNRYHSTNFYINTNLLVSFKDNQSYAFINGISNPFINWIANRYYLGYKSNSDLHARAYKGQQTNNRN